VLELALETRRGSFRLQVECKLAAPLTVVFGPSGAGKTTLLRLLAGLDQARQSSPVAGRVVLDGLVLTDTAKNVWRAPGHRRIGFVTQEPSLFPHLTAAENVGYGLRDADRESRTARVSEMLELVDGTGHSALPPRNLSGGQAQRIALARALATNPRLLLLDEPFSALDGIASDALLARLQAWLQARNVQAVLATHDVSDALATAAEVLLLREGRLVTQGPAAQVLGAERDRLLGRLQYRQT